MSKDRPNVPDDGKLHGPEIDEALGFAETHTPPFLGLCLTALRTRTDQIIDSQLKSGMDPEAVEEAKKALMHAGAPFDDEIAAGVVIRSAIGGTFTMGIATGLKLASMMDPEQLKAIIESPGEVEDAAPDMPPPPV